MKIAIVGAGKVGYQLARYLSREKNDVLVIDNRPKLVSHVNDTLDASAHLGSGIDPRFLDQVGMRDCDMVIAVTRSDETNMIACQIAYSMFDVDLRVARVRSPDLYHFNSIQLFSPDHIPVNLAISPEYDIAQAILRRISLPGATEIIPIGHNFPHAQLTQEAALVIGVRCNDDCPIIHTPLRQLSVLFPDLQITVLAILRDQRVIMPTSDDEMLSGDVVYFSTFAEHARRSMSAFGHDETRGNKLTILGGGLVGQSLLESIDKLPFITRCRVIEKNQLQAQRLAKKVPDLTIINGDAIDLELLEDLSISHDEIVVAVTNSEEANIVAASMYKNYGSKTTIALVGNQRLGAITENFTLDGVINPRNITISTVLHLIRRGRIHRAHTFLDGMAECLEGEVLRGSPLAGSVIKDMDLPDGVKIASILREGRFYLPRPDSDIQIGDIVTVMALVANVKEAQHLLSVKLESF